MKKSFSTKLIFFAMLFGSMSINGFAQDSKPDMALKLYSNFAWSSSNQVVGFDTISNNVIYEEIYDTDFGYFSPSFTLSADNGNFHEFELSRLQFNKRNNKVFIDESNGLSPQILAGEQRTDVLIALRYEYNFVFFKKRANHRFEPSVGFAVQPYFSQSSFQPVMSNLFPSSESMVGTVFSIVPRINYSLSEKWFIDLNVPLRICEANLAHSRFQNPAIPENQQTISTINITTGFQSSYLIRFGVGFKI